MNEWTIFIGIIILSFSIGDLIGHENLIKLESKIYKKSKEYIVGWYSYLKASRIVVQYMTGLLVTSILHISITLGFIYFVPESLYTIGYVIWLLATFLISIRILNQLVEGGIEYLPKSWSIHLDLVYLRYFGYLFAKSYEYYEKAEKIALDENVHMRRKVNPLALFIFPAILFSATFPIVFVISFLLKTINILVRILVLITICYPCLMLYKIATKLGAESYFNVGKYIFSVLAFIASIFVSSPESQAIENKKHITMAIERDVPSAVFVCAMYSTSPMTCAPETRNLPNRKANIRVHHAFFLSTSEIQYFLIAQNKNRRGHPLASRCQ